MRETNVLICDEDSSYALALVRFLIGSGKGFRVTYDTDIDSFKKDEGNYRIALMTAPFLRELEMEEAGHRTISHIIQLCGSEESAYRSYECIYKFQAMDEFLDRLCRLDWDIPGNAKKENGHTYFTGILSPIHHELALPFSMLYSRMCEEKGKTIFLDLEENSIMGQLTRREPRSTVLDCIYQADLDGPAFHLGEYTDSYSGFSYVGPVTNPTDLSGIDENQWLRFFESVRKEHYSQAVILFGMLPQGFDVFLPMFDQILLLGRSGDYYQKSQKQFTSYLERSTRDLPIRQVFLPMSAGNLGNTEYEMEEMTHGNLGIFMRRTFQTGRERVPMSFPQEKAYAAG